MDRAPAPVNAQHRRRSRSTLCPYTCRTPAIRGKSWPATSFAAAADCPLVRGGGPA